MRFLLGADRTAAEPEAISALAAACACLPLALRIAAAHLTDRPHQTIAEYIAQLKADDPTVMLKIEGDEEAAVGAAFNRSYVALPEAARIVFRRLGLVPLPEFSTPAVAALAGLGEDKATRVLETLEAAHLVSQNRPGRYTLHDLLRRYARNRLDTEEIDRSAAPPYRGSSIGTLPWPHRPPRSSIQTVLGDGVTLVSTGVRRGGQAAQRLSVNVSGRSVLRLAVGNGGDNINYDHADWANAQVTCA